jgi:hypothetical protein
MQTVTFTEAVIIGDSAFLNNEWLATPLLHPQTQQEAFYNYSHKHSRSVVECTIGLLKQRFRGLLDGLRTKNMAFAVRTIKAAIVLHNLCLSYDPLGDGEIGDMLRAADIAGNNNEAADDEMNVVGDRRRRLIESFPLV